MCACWRSLAVVVSVVVSPSALGSLGPGGALVEVEEASWRVVTNVHDLLVVVLVHRKAIIAGMSSAGGMADAEGGWCDISPSISH